MPCKITELYDIERGGCSAQIDHKVPRCRPNTCFRILLPDVATCPAETREQRRSVSAQSTELFVNRLQITQLIGWLIGNEDVC